MAKDNFLAAQARKGTFYAASLACLCGVPLTTCLEWLKP